MFKVPSALLLRTLAFKAIKHKNGKVTLWDIPATINPNYVTVYQQKLLEQMLGRQKMIDIVFSCGKFQGTQVFKIISERFGYAKTIPDKKKLLEFETSQGIVAGHGQFRWKIMDFKNKRFFGEGLSPFAEEFKRFFGLQKHAVDHFVRGEACAFVEQVTGEPMGCIETKCIAKGNKLCEFLILPIAKCKKDPRYKNQSFNPVPDLKKLGSKVEPYLAMH